MKFNNVDTIIACGGILYFSGDRIATFDCGVNAIHRAAFEILGDNLVKIIYLS